MPTTPPGVPELLSVTATAPGTLTMRWRDNTHNETGFEVQRRTSGGVWTTEAMLPADATSYTDTDPLRVGVAYSYRVRAVNASGKSAWSNTLSGTPTSAPPPPPPPPPTGTARYAATYGSAAGDGTALRPWSLGVALDGRFAPGETLLLRGGTYPTTGYGPLGAEVRLAGTQAKPIHIRAYPGERVIIDGGLRFVAPTSDVWLWDVEVIVSAPRRPAREADGHDPHRQWGGINLEAGPRCKLIHCTVRDCSQGVSAWRGATDLEVYGCILYDNGWDYIDVNGNDNSTGYAIYAQNEGPGWKTFRDNLLLDTYSYTLHLYGESSGLTNVLLEGNVIAQPARADLAIVGSVPPSRNIRVLDNWWVNSKTWLGYLFSNSNENLEVRNNLAVGGYFNIHRNWASVQQSGNVVVEDAGALGIRTLLRPSKYDPSRANLAVIADADGAHVSLAPFLATGDRYRLLDPRNLWGAPVREGTWQGPISVPLVEGFGAWVVRRI